MRGAGIVFTRGCTRGPLRSAPPPPPVVRRAQRSALPSPAKLQATAAGRCWAPTNTPAATAGAWPSAIVGVSGAAASRTLARRFELQASSSVDLPSPIFVDSMPAQAGLDCGRRCELLLLAPGCLRPGN